MSELSKALRSSEIKLRSKLIRKNKKKDNWLCNEWDCYIIYKDKVECFEYYTGIGIKNKPNLADVINSIIMDGMSSRDSSFTEWCDESGYSNDSVKALVIYLKSQENYRRLIKLIGYYEINKLQQMEH